MKCKKELKEYGRHYLDYDEVPPGCNCLHCKVSKREALKEVESIATITYEVEFSKGKVKNTDRVQYLLIPFKKFKELSAK